VCCIALIRRHGTIGRTVHCAFDFSESASGDTRRWCFGGERSTQVFERCVFHCHDVLLFVHRVLARLGPWAMRIQAASKATRRSSSCLISIMRRFASLWCSHSKAAGDLLAAIISNDAAVAVTLAAKAQRNVCRTHIAEHGGDFRALCGFD
jgi:hypothetical protein